MPLTIYHRYTREQLEKAKAAAGAKDRQALKALTVTTKELTDAEIATLFDNGVPQGVLDDMDYEHLYTLAELQAIFRKRGLAVDSDIAR